MPRNMVVALLLIGSVSACTTSDPTLRGAGRGAAIGGAGGAVAGAVIPGLSVGEGAAVGAVGGAAIGAITADKDRSYHRDRDGNRYYVDNRGRRVYVRD
ncbi:hypothetical protein ACFB49_24680 [Sphingomonas sp. DBB INV C78]|uniref:hypothetical protein n=1 Tax=Sphingomonas sp. DBB INV C78 TaxID=3349434 RepID=UPI0036D3984B